MTLFDKFLAHTGRTIHKLDCYFDVYERHFGRFVGEPVTFLEIGSGLGGSAQFFRDYLGPRAKIVSIDIREECKAFEEERISVRIGHQGDPAFLASVISEFGPPDIVLDDGSHLAEDHIASFTFLYPGMARNGVYLVEDLQTAYMQGFGGGLNRPGTFIEHAKDLIDQLNATWNGLDGKFASETHSIHCYNNIVVIERGGVEDPRAWRRVPEPR